MKKTLLLTLLMVCALGASAQTYLEHLQTKESGKGTVIVHQSQELNELINGTLKDVPNKTTSTVKKQNTPESKVSKRSNGEEEIGDDISIVDTSKKIARGATKVTGYRVQVYAGGNSRADKTKAERIGSQIKNSFPGQPVYVHFYSPRWICRMGNFRTYEDAQAMLTRVRAAGFTQASLVKGQITVTD